VTEAAAEIGIPYLTLYAFSTENWNRPRLEVNALMDMLVITIKEELETMNRNNIRLSAIGDIDHLPPATRKALLQGIANTQNNTRMTLTWPIFFRWECGGHKAANLALEGQ
jgi:undecaprenyl diphosphate synthase